MTQELCDEKTTISNLFQDEENAPTPPFRHGQAQAGCLMSQGQPYVNLEARAYGAAEEEAAHEGYEMLHQHETV